MLYQKYTLGFVRRPKKAAINFCLDTIVHTCFLAKRPEVLQGSLLIIFFFLI